MRSLLSTGSGGLGQMERRVKGIFSRRSASGAQVVVDQVTGGAVHEPGQAFRLTQLLASQGAHDRQHHLLRQVAGGFRIARSCEDQEPDSVGENADEFLLCRGFVAADALSETALLLGRE